MDGSKMITRIFWAVIIIGIIAIGAHVHDSKDTEKTVASEPDTPQTTWYDLMLNHKVDTFIDPTIACPTSGSRSSYVSQSSPSGDSYDAGYDAGFEDGYAAGAANNSFGAGYMMQTNFRARMLRAFVPDTKPATSPDSRKASLTTTMKSKKNP